MPATINNSEHVALDGPIGLPIAIGIALVLLCLFTWSLSRERKILGIRQTIIFWLLRATALGVVIWMLLDPTRMLVEVSTTRKSVALLMDVSGSMQTLDPEATSDDLRWAVFQGDRKSFTATQSADQAWAAAGIAEKQLQTASEAILQHQRESLVVETTGAANMAIHSVQRHLQSLSKELKSANSGWADDSARGLAASLTKQLEGSEFSAFDELCRALEKGKTPSEKGWRESLPDLQIRMAGIRRQLSELAGNVALREEQYVQSNQPQLLSAIQREPRMNRVAAFVDSLNSDALKLLREKADVKISTFDQSPVVLNPRTTARELVKGLLPGEDTDTEAHRELAAKSGTNITSVLEQLSRDRSEQPLAAAFILSDVSHNRTGVASPREAAASLGGTPVYVVPVGNTQYVRDVLVQSIFCPAVAMRNDDVVIEAVIQAYDCEGENCLVQLLQDGDVIDTRTVSVDSGFATRQVRFDQKMSEVGVQRFQISVSPVKNELTEQNNADDFEVNVTRSEIKLLLADEMPRWEYRYLAQLFRRDPRVELDEMLFHPRLVATGKRAMSGTFPVTADEWDQYDVVILGDLTPEHFPVAAQTSLIEYLEERGGTLILIAGKESMPALYEQSPIGTVLPVTRTEGEASTGDDRGYSFHVTDAGQSHNALMIGETEEATKVAWEFINQFAPLHEVSPWRLPRPSATTLISAVPKGTLDQDHAARTSAFLCWQPVGRGRVVYLAGPETFRLRFLRGDRLHYRFWGQMLRWALASDLSAGTEVVRIRSDKAQYSAGESIQIVVRLTDSSGQPVVTSENLQAIARQGDQVHSAPLIADELIPGQYRGELKTLPSGDYQIEPAGPPISKLLQDSGQQMVSASFSVQPELPAEFLDTRSDRGLAQQIADITGGQVLPPTAVEEVLRLTNLEPEVTNRLESRPLWLQWKFLWIVFGCLQAEWIVRKVKGLS